MRIIKKTITKDDGRLLTYYHFPKTASESQKQAFEGVQSDEVTVRETLSGANEKTDDAIV